MPCPNPVSALCGPGFFLAKRGECLVRIPLNSDACSKANQPANPIRTQGLNESNPQLAAQCLMGTKADVRTDYGQGLFLGLCCRWHRFRSMAALAPLQTLTE